jgi:hypothetical protein
MLKPFFWAKIHLKNQPGITTMQTYRLQKKKINYCHQHLRFMNRDVANVATPITLAIITP